MKKWLILFVILLLPLVVAHQPRFSEEYNVVSNPTVSQAYYGSLEGSVHTFEIELNGEDLYLSMLLPDLEGVDKDLMFTVTSDDFVYELTSTEWVGYYEEHAGDDYLQGSEYLLEDQTGKFIVEVSNSDNNGKYVFVVGKKEEFPLNEIIRTVYVAPKLKVYFEKSPFLAFTTPTMIGFLLVSLLLVVGVVGLSWYVIRRVRRH